MPIAAKMGDKVLGTDTHIVMVPSPGGPVATPTPLPFNGIILSGCSRDVLIEGKPAATVGSVAKNIPPHIAPNGPFQKPPTNEGKVIAGSSSVMINKKPAARGGDKVMTCNDPAPAPTSTIQALGKVMIGG